MIEAKIEALTAAIERLTVVIERTVVAPDLSPKAAKAAKADKVIAETETASPIYTAPTEVVEINPATGVPDLPDRKALEKECIKMSLKDRKLYDVIKKLIATHSDGNERLADVPDSELQAFADALAAL